MKKFCTKFQMWLVALVASFAFAANAFAAGPDATISFTDEGRVWTSQTGNYWTNNGVTAYVNNWQDTYAYLSFNGPSMEFLKVVSDDKNIAKIVLNGGHDLVASAGNCSGNTWTGSATEVTIWASVAEVDVTSIDVYFEGAPAEPETVEVTRTGATLKVSLPKAAVQGDTYGEGYGASIPAGLTVVDPSNNPVAIAYAYSNYQNDKFTIVLAAEPTVVGEYTVNVPAGIIAYSMTELNDALTGTFTVKAPAEKADYLDSTYPEVGNVASDFTGVAVSVYFTKNIKSYDVSKVLVNNAPAPYVSNWSVGYPQLDVNLAQQGPLEPGVYTVLIEEGAIEFEDGKVNEQLLLVYTVLAPATDVEVFDYSNVEPGEVALDAFQSGLYIYTKEAFVAVDGAQATVNGENATTFFYGNDKCIFVSMPNPLKAGKTYTVVLPAGSVKVGDLPNKEITLVYTTAVENGEPIKFVASDASGLYFATYYADYAWEIPEGVVAYTISGVNANNFATIATVTGVVPARTGVLVLNGTAGNVDVVKSSENPDPIQGNLLRGVVADETVTAAAGESLYKLSLNEEGQHVAFYWDAANGASLAAKAYKAYLAVPAAAASNGISIRFDELTGINSVIAPEAGEAIYNLQGQRVNATQAGVYVKNGKKFIVK